MRSPELGEYQDSQKICSDASKGTSLLAEHGSAYLVLGSQPYCAVLISKGGNLAPTWVITLAMGASSQANMDPAKMLRGQDVLAQHKAADDGLDEEPLAETDKLFGCEKCR